METSTLVQTQPNGSGAATEQPPSPRPMEKIPEEPVSVSPDPPLTNGMDIEETPALGVSGASPTAAEADTSTTVAEGELNESFATTTETLLSEDVISDNHGQEGGVKLTAPQLLAQISSAQLQQHNKPSSGHLPPPPPSSSPFPPSAISTNSIKPGRQPKVKVTSVNYYRYMPLPNQPLFYSTAQAQGYAPPSHSAPHPPTTLTHQDFNEPLSSTNLYIRGLSRSCTDEDLVKLCQHYGRIVSTKAILDKASNMQCKGYGFVDFENPADAQRAVMSLQSSGVLVQFAKVPQQQEQDPTNLYISNLPKDLDEKTLEQLILPYGTIVSTRILRDGAGNSRGVGFARMASKEHCEKVIELLNGATLPGTADSLMVKFADCGSSKKKSRWRDMQEQQQQYLYESPSVMTQNGLVNQRPALMQQGVLATQYVHPPTLPGYQVPVSSGVPGHGWQQAAYFMPTPANNHIPGTSSVDGVSGLASQMGQVHISTTGGGYSVSTPHSQPFIPHGNHYPAPQQPHSGGGWAIPTSVLQQQSDGTAGIGGGGGGGEHHHHSVAAGLATESSKSTPHHIQVISPEHATGTLEDGSHGAVHVYYPAASTWSGSK